ncbi:hypothetical protein WKK05_41140 (plasmid) [Nostoc sp. UHCC 0302]|uniref:hypothetical protein n=1 Tax=Nostoc sp. UHCC 0302 TaxID=3134896 RepID=UPI00311CC5AC
MPKARRRLSDLVQEETQKPRATDLQTSEVTNSVSLPETSSQTNSVESVTEQETDNLTDLQSMEVTNSVSLPETSSQTDTAEEITELQTLDVSESVAVVQVEEKGKGVNQVTKPQSLEVTDLQSSEVPKYLKLERKEARLRQDQIDALTDLTRKLNRMKRGKGGERLTDNTLIRVAVDLLLSKASELQGTTEEELKSSLNL